MFSHFVINLSHEAPQFLHWALIQLNNVPADYYLAIIGALPLSFALSFLKTFAKRKWDTEPSEVKMFLTNLGGIAFMALIAYLNSNGSSDPYTAIASLILPATVLQQPLYFKLVKPLMQRVWDIYDKSLVASTDVTSAAVPAAGLPIEAK